MDGMSEHSGAAVATDGRRGTAAEVLLVFLRLGLTSFGGPIAHLGYFHEEFVVRRKWLDEQAYVDLVALCQFLPGPASSQVGFSIGLMRAGYCGALAAWTGFTLPSAIAIVLFAYGAGALIGPVGTGLLHGLKLVAVAIVAQAVWGMARTLCPDKERASIAVVAALVILFSTSSVAQILAIVLGGLAGLWLCRGAQPVAGAHMPIPVGRAIGAGGVDAVLRSAPGAADPAERRSRARRCAVRCLLSIRRACLRRRPCRAAAVAPSLCRPRLGQRRYFPGRLWRRAGGSRSAVHLRGLSRDSGQTVAARRRRRGVGTDRHLSSRHFDLARHLPFWETFRKRAGAQAVMRGINAAVVGLLGAALYNPVWTSSVKTPGDFGVALVGFVLLTVWRAPPLLVVIVGALGGIALAIAKL